MLTDKIYDGKSAAEILEETKKYYVKTRELKENKIDISTPRLFKSSSEEEMEQIISETRKQPLLKYPMTSNMLRVTQSFCYPTTCGTAFCITGSTDQPYETQSFCTSATSAFQPVIRTPPRPPKSEKLREKQKLQIHSDTASTSANSEASLRPIPPPRRSLQKSNSRPIPPPRQQITMTTSYNLPSNFIPFEPITSNISNALSTPNLMNHRNISSFEPYRKPQTENLMTSSWYGPSTMLHSDKHSMQRIRIPVKPNQLTATVLKPKVVKDNNNLPKLIKPIPLRSPESALKIMRSQSSITPSRLTNFYSPGTTSGAGTTSGTSLSNPLFAEFSTPNIIIQNILSSPTASKDSGAHDCSNVGSEIDEPEIKHVDKDFEERIKRWDNCLKANERNMTQHLDVEMKPKKPPSTASKPVISNQYDLNQINKFFDRCGLNSISDKKDIEDVPFLDISSIDSNFTSITDNNKKIQFEMAAINQSCSDTDSNVMNNQQQKSSKIATKPVSVIEKNARVIQWIHGCTLASTVC